MSHNDFYTILDKPAKNADSHKKPIQPGIAVGGD